MSWQEIDLEPGFGPFEALLNLVKSLGEAAQAVLEPVATILDALEAVIAALAGESFDVGSIFDLATKVNIVHLYPAQPYQAMRFSKWCSTMQRSIELGRVSARQTIIPDVVQDLAGYELEECVLPPAAFFAIGVSEDSTARLLERANTIARLFGKTVSGFTDLPPILDRSKQGARPARCRNLTTQLPYLQSVLDLLLSTQQLSAPNGITIMKNAAIAKINQITRILNEVEAFFDLLENLKVPGVFVFTGEISSLDTLSSELQGATNAPQFNAYFAGSGMLLSGAALSFIKTLLALGD